jgi:hypothetical protein
MKNSKEYGKKIAKLYRSLKQKQVKVKKRIFDDPAEAIVYAIISENMRKSAAKSVFKKTEAHFVNLNDLRVSRAEEIYDIMDVADGDSKKIASDLTEFLGAIYLKYDTVNLEGLKEIGKRQARKDLEGLGILSRFAICYCFLTSLGGHAIPLTKEMVEYLKDGEFVHPDASDGDIEGFLERQITAANGYEFYTLVREKSEKGRIKKVKAVKSQPASKEKSEKKTKKAVKKKTKKKSKKATKAKNK